MFAELGRPGRRRCDAAEGQPCCHRRYCHLNAPSPDSPWKVAGEGPKCASLKTNEVGGGWHCGRRVTRHAPVGEVTRELGGLYRSRPESFTIMRWNALAGTMRCMRSAMRASLPTT